MAPPICKPENRAAVPLPPPPVQSLVALIGFEIDCGETDIAGGTGGAAADGTGGGTGGAPFCVMDDAALALDGFLAKEDMKSSKSISLPAAAAAPPPAPTPAVDNEAVEAPLP